MTNIRRRKIRFSQHASPVIKQSPRTTDDGDIRQPILANHPQRYFKEPPIDF